MSASHHRWFRRAIIGWAVAGAMVMAGCAGPRAARPDLPDQSVLDPAQKALAKAVSAHADQFAPRIIDSARRRLTVARDILFAAAEADRPLRDAEHDRVQGLVDQARLDARAALVKTQAGAVEQKLDQLQGGDNHGAATGGPVSPSNGDGQQGPGIPASGPGPNNPIGKSS